MKVTGFIIVSIQQMTIFHFITHIHEMTLIVVLLLIDASIKYQLTSFLIQYAKAMSESRSS